MEPGIQKLIKELESELGYTEKSNGYTKFGEWYSKNVDDSYNFANAAWCDMFLAWGADRAGVTEQVGQFAYTPSHASWFRKHGAFGTEPEAGSIVFFDWAGGSSISGIDHIGIVTKVDGGRVHTIEGNVDGKHARRKVRDQSKIVGYGYPDRVETEGARKEREAAKGGGEEKEGDTGAAAGAPPAGGTGTGVNVAHSVSLPTGSGGPPVPELLSVLLAIAVMAVALAVALRRGRRRGRHARGGGAHRATGQPSAVGAASATGPRGGSRRMPRHPLRPAPAAGAR